MKDSKFVKGIKEEVGKMKESGKLRRKTLVKTTCIALVAYGIGVRNGHKIGMIRGGLQGYVAGAEDIVKAIKDLKK